MSRPYRPLKPSESNVVKVGEIQRTTLNDDTIVWVISDYNDIPVKSTVTNYLECNDRCDWIEYPVTYSIVDNPVKYAKNRIASLQEQIKKFETFITEVSKGHSTT